MDPCRLLVVPIYYLPVKLTSVLKVENSSQKWNRMHCNNNEKTHSLYLLSYTFGKFLYAIHKQVQSVEVDIGLENAQSFILYIWKVFVCNTQAGTICWSGHRSWKCTIFYLIHLESFCMQYTSRYNLLKWTSVLKMHIRIFRREIMQFLSLGKNGSLSDTTL